MHDSVSSDANFNACGKGVRDELNGAVNGACFRNGDGPKEQGWDSDCLFKKWKVIHVLNRENEFKHEVYFVNHKAKMEAMFSEMTMHFLTDFTTTYPEWLESHPNLLSIVAKDEHSAEHLDVVSKAMSAFILENHIAITSEDDAVFVGAELFGIPFEPVWAEASVKTRESIWKYLKLLSIMTMTPKGEDMAALIEEMMKQEATPMMGEFMNGKIAAMAKDIAAKTGDPKELLSNPAKMMDMMKEVGAHIEENIQSGKVKESELIEEAATLMDRMETDPTMKQYMNMLPAGMNMSGMKQKLNTQLRKVRERERLQEVLRARQAKAAEAPVETKPAAKPKRKNKKHTK